MGETVQNLVWEVEQNDPPASLALPLLFSVILHLAVLSLFNWDGLRIRNGGQRNLTVTLVPAALTEDRRMQDLAGQVLKFPGQDEVIEALDSDKSGYRLDLDQIRTQARAYSRQELATSGQTLPQYGDYYGTYTGDDSGVFSFHLDHTGQVSGSGESSGTGIVFFISGNIAPDGVMHMVARRNDAKANLSGRLNIRSGQISGSWHVFGIAEGLFSGQHEQQDF